MSDLPGDPISPTEIQHCVDEFLGESGECYNYLDYHFVAESAYCRARAYSDEMDMVTMFGPFENRNSINKVVSPVFERDVLSYLSRRFALVTRP